MSNWSRGRGLTADKKAKIQEVWTFTKGIRNLGEFNDGAILKSADYTVTQEDLGKPILVNCTSSAVTITLPAAPTAYDLVIIEDAKASFGTNDLTVARNSEKIEGVASDVTFSDTGAKIELRYIDSTFGWKVKVY